MNHLTMSNTDMPSVGRRGRSRKKVSFLITRDPFESVHREFNMFCKNYKFPERQTEVYDCWGRLIGYSSYRDMTLPKFINH